MERGKEERQMPVRDKDGDQINGNKTKEIMTHAKDKVQKRRFKGTIEKSGALTYRGARRSRCTSLSLWSSLTLSMTNERNASS